jgi:hypothetical protein
MKTCKRCGETKPYDGFYRHSAMGDGYLSFCRECTKARIAKHREANLDRIREYDRNRPNFEVRRIKNNENRKLRGHMWKKIQESDPLKQKARRAVQYALKTGRIKVEPCERCGFAIGVHAHHEDYSKPLDIMWLCRTCHGERHREINEERRRSA